MAKGQIKNKREIQKLVTIAEYAQKNALSEGDFRHWQILGIISALKWVLADEETALETALGNLDTVYDPEVVVEHSDLV